MDLKPDYFTTIPAGVCHEAQDWVVYCHVPRSGQETSIEVSAIAGGHGGAIDYEAFQSAADISVENGRFIDIGKGLTRYQEAENGEPSSLLAGQARKRRGEVGLGGTSRWV